MADHSDPGDKAKSSPRPPVHEGTFEPVTIKAPFAGPRLGGPSPLSENVDEGNRRRADSFLGAAASPAAIRAKVVHGSMEHLGSVDSHDEAKSEASTATLVDQRQITYLAGVGAANARSRTSGTHRSKQRTPASRLRGESVNEGMSDTEEGLEEGMGGGSSTRQAGRIKKQRIFTRADPKSYFSNERTMYSWMHVNLLTLSYSLSLYAYSHFAGADPTTDVAATFASAAALILTVCSAVKFRMRQDILASNENWVTRLSRRRFRGRGNTVSGRKYGNDARHADAFDDSVFGYPLLVTALIIAVLIVNVVCIYRAPAYKPHRSRSFVA